MEDEWAEGFTCGAVQGIRVGMLFAKLKAADRFPAALVTAIDGLLNVGTSDAMTAAEEALEAWAGTLE